MLTLVKSKLRNACSINLMLTEGFVTSWFSGGLDFAFKVHLSKMIKENNEMALMWSLVGVFLMA